MLIEKFLLNRFHSWDYSTLFVRFGNVQGSNTICLISYLDQQNLYLKLFIHFLSILLQTINSSFQGKYLSFYGSEILIYKL